MIGPFEGPNLLTVPHARLVYSISSRPKDLWSEWPNEILKIDQFLESQPKIHLAHDALFLYFFGEEAKEAWVGREIVGHSTHYPEGLKSFDSFKGEVFEWTLPTAKAFKLKKNEIFEAERQLRALAGSALASTWRLKIEGLGPLSQALEKGKVSFQFYKLV